MNVEPGGVVCGCGSRGCLECYASGPAIAGAALRALVQQNDTLIRELVKNDYNKVTATIVAEAAEQGDQVAKDILTNAGKIYRADNGECCRRDQPGNGCYRRRRRYKPVAFYLEVFAKPFTKPARLSNRKPFNCDSRNWGYWPEFKEALHGA